MERSHFIDIPQGSFHYLTCGTKGEQIFFCHGNSMSAGTYLPFLQKLSSRGYQVTAPDVRGHGASTKENTQKILNWDIFLKDLEQLVKTITKPPVIGMGHSMGGYFIYAAAALYPELFSKIILLDPIILNRKQVWGAALMRKTKLAHRYPMARMARNKKSEFESKAAALEHYSGKGMFKTWEPEFVQAYVDTAIEKEAANTCRLCCAPEFEAQMYTMVPFNTWQHVKHITVPVLVARGEYSAMFPRKSGFRLKQKIKTCEFIELEKLGHFFTMENPDLVMDRIIPFL